MKKIFIMAHSMEIGGAEKSLLGILENINIEEYQVDLFLLRHQGELMQYIPKHVHLFPENSEYAMLGIPLLQVLKQKKIKMVYARCKGKRKALARERKLGIIGENNIGNEYSHKYTTPILPQISIDNYDLAISFMSPHYFVMDKIYAKKKIAWIHTDYATFKVDVDSELKMWSRYDHIISISDEVSKSFLQTFPSLKAKIIHIENIMPGKYMRILSDAINVEEEMPSDGTIKLLTIGRFTTAKKMEEIPEICKKIRRQGLNIKWYLIGFGSEEKLIYEKINENEMQEYVIILGKKENPYPYIRKCDFYVQPSRYEGKSIAVREAQFFGKPVAITNYSTAHGQLEDGEDGIIVPMDIDGTVKGIVSLIRDEKLQKKLQDNMKHRDYIQQSEIKKIYQLME